MNYTVPEGMRMAAVNAVGGVYTTALQAAIEWLAENPIVPTENQLQDLRGDSPCDNQKDHQRWMVTEWQRRMFRADEAADPVTTDPLTMHIMRHFDDLLDDKRSLLNRATAAVEDYYHSYDHGQVCRCCGQCTAILRGEEEMRIHQKRWHSKVPEAIRDLTYSPDAPDGNSVDPRIIEAYRRGRKKP